SNIVEGSYHIKAAWAARGGGFANTVTEEGWRKMAEELALARKCLTEAYRLHPDYPEAATQMISVVMGEPVGLDGPGKSLRLWLNRAVEAQFDFDQAYQNYIYANYPRWHGSYLSMYEFGRECADTARFDTRVPYYLVEVLNQIQSDSEGDWSFWHQQ